MLQVLERGDEVRQGRERTRLVYVQKCTNGDENSKR